MTKYWLASVAVLVGAVIILSFQMEKLRIEKLPKYELTHEKTRFKVDVVCNRFYDLDLILEIQPPIDIADMAKARDLVVGTVEVKFSKEDSLKSINLRDAGSYYAGGLWKKIIYKSKASIYRTCENESLDVHVRDLNINLSRHRVFIYFARDLRP